MTVELRAGELAAAFEPEAGLVCRSLLHRGEELLGQRQGMEGWLAERTTFGIPFLHPWANRLAAWGYGDVEIPRDSPAIKPEERGLPLHGTLHGDAAWTVETATATGLVASLAYDRPDWLAAFPWRHALTVRAALDPGGLTIETELRATDGVAVPVSFGWHPYLQLPGVPLPDWEVEATVRRRAVLDARAIPTGEVVDAPVPAGPLGDLECDDSYVDGAGARFALRGGGRTIEVSSGEGYTHAHFFVDQEKGILAFEPMTAAVDALRTGDGLRWVAPGEAFRAVFRVAVA